MINNIKITKKPIFSTHTHTHLSPFLAILFLATSFVFANADTGIDQAGPVRRSLPSSKARTSVGGCRKKVICADTVKAKTICADELIVKTGCCACRTITAKDFMDADGNLSQTFVITEPGKYCLGENITFAPVDEDAAAIQILANDVKLDLCGNTLTQGNDTFEVFAIQIGEGFFYNDPDNVLKNITITNGNITRFTGSGILCYNASFDGPTTQAAFEDLTFADLNILDCGSQPSFVISGIYLDSFADITLYDPATRVAYKNVIIDNCKVNRCLGNGSVYIYTGDNVVINNIQANDLSTEVAVFSTFAYWLFCRNLQMFNCQGNGAIDLDPTAFGNAVGGTFIGDSINVYLKDCQFNDSFGEVDVLVFGAAFTNTQNAIYENCQFNNARGGKGSVEVSAIHMSDRRFQQTQGNGIKFINCQFNGASISDENPGGSPVAGIFGFLGATLRNIVFENCQACNIITENPGFGAYGYFAGTILEDPAPRFGNVQNITYSNCTATDITGGRDAIGIFASLGSASRTGEQGLQSNIVIENCVAERIHSTSAVDRVAGIAEGLWLFRSNQPFPSARNLFVRNCRVSDVRIDGDNISPLSAGILVESVINPGIYNNSVSDCDRGILLTGLNEIFPANLFQLATSAENAEAFPPIFIDLTSIPDAMPLQAFSNLDAGNTIEISPSISTIELSRNYIYAPVNLNTLGWQVGDPILYDTNGGTAIGGLEDDTVYYLIVNVPGFSENGVIQNNAVDNCTIAGYQDDRTPTTNSAWINNFAFNNGDPATAQANYEIDWAGVVPVMAGDLANYPTGAEKAYNVSLVP